MCQSMIQIKALEAVMPLRRRALDRWRDDRMAQQRAIGAVPTGQAARKACSAGHAGKGGRPPGRQQA